MSGIRLTADLIYGFSNTVLAPNFHDAVATPEFHKELWEFYCSDDRYVAVAAPRGHAKTTAGTHVFGLAALCFRVSEHLMVVSDTEGQACSFIGDMKRELTDNEDLRSLFGVKGLKKDRETEFIVEFEDGHIARVIAKGSEQKLRGLKWNNKRPDLILCDDLENDEIVMNDDRRDKFRRWFFNALIPCGSKNSKVRVAGTILHLDSLLERLMPPLGGPYTVEDGLKQYYANDDREWHSVRYKAHNEDFSLILWPEQFSEKDLRQKRNMYLEQGFPEGYSQEYLNYPIDEAMAYFKKKDFLDIDEDGEPEEFYISADLAISEKDRNAYTVFVIAANTPNNTLRVRHVSRFRGDTLDIIDEIFNLYVRYKPELFFIEQENIARTLGPILNKEQQERGIFIPIQPMTASQDKIKRARSLQSRMRAGRVQFKRDEEWFPVLQQEMLQFPRGAYKDQVDALAWIALGIDKIFEAPTRQEVMDQTWHEEYDKHAEDDFLSNRSQVTGY